VKRWCKRLAYPAAGLALLLVLVVLAERIRGEWALKARLKALAVKGEALSLAELKPKRPAPEQNVFTKLLLLTNRWAVTVSNLDIAPPSLRLTSPGRAVVVAKLDEWSHDGGRTNDWQELGLGLEQARDILASLESAVQKPAYDGGTDYEKGFVDIHLTPIVEVKRACQLLSWSVGFSGAGHSTLPASHRQASRAAF
jgi:hypothetical protein